MFSARDKDLQWILLLVFCISSQAECQIVKLNLFRNDTRSTLKVEGVHGRRTGKRQSHVARSLVFFDDQKGNVGSGTIPAFSVQDSTQSTVAVCCLLFVSSAFAGLLCVQDDINFSKWVQWVHAALVIGHVLLTPINRLGEILHKKTGIVPDPFSYHRKKAV